MDHSPGFLAHVEGRRPNVHEVSIPEALAALQAALLAQGECQPDTLRRAARMLHAVDQRAALRDVRVPTLVIAGEYDRLVHPRASAALAELLPDARFVQIAKAGHAPFLSHPAEVIAVLRAFLEA